VGKDTAMPFRLVKVRPLRGFAKNLQASLCSARIFRKNLDKPGMAVLFAHQRELPLVIINI
jgi:hypothetical protein